MLYRLRRRISKTINETVHRIDYEKFRKALARLEIDSGSTVCVHSALRNLGHFADGPEGAVHALQDTVGSDGTILMPTFAFSGSMLAQVDSGAVFDVRETPSKVGFLTEFFRKQDGVLRSLHPTHAIAGWGAKAAHYLNGHEQSETPFGLETPYGRLADDDKGYMLMLETRLLSLPHHLQERVSFPNLYLPGLKELEYIDDCGRSARMKTQVMRPKIPYYLAIPPPSGDEPAWCVVHDFCLIFPNWRKAEIREMGSRLEGYPQILARRADLEKLGVLRSTRLGKGEIGLLNVAEFIRLVEPELRELLDRYSAHYTLDNVKKKNKLSVTI